MDEESFRVFWNYSSMFFLIKLPFAPNIMNMIVDMTMKLAHQGSHTGQTVMLRQLRYPFFFHDMDGQVE